MPVQISFGCSDIREQVEFYNKVLEAKILHLENDMISNIDGHVVSYAFLQPVNDRIEIKYVQRPIDYTYGKFTTELYKNLLVKTHNDRITSPVCGLDRWFDNHYGYNTLKFAADPVHYNYLDRVLYKLNERGLKWRLYHTPYEDESPEGKYWMASYGFGDMFTLYVFDANGQTIQMIGEFRDQPVGFVPPIYHKQWCYVPCPGRQQMGSFDPTYIYAEDTNDIVYKAVMEQNKKYNKNEITLEELQAEIPIAIETIDGNDEDKKTQKVNKKKQLQNKDSVNEDQKVENEEEKEEIEKEDDAVVEIEEQDIVEDEIEDDIVDGDLETGEEEIIESSHHNKKHNVYIAMIACITIGVVACALIVFCAYRCIMKQRNTGDNSLFEANGERQSLLPHKRRIAV